MIRSHPVKESFLTRASELEPYKWRLILISVSFIFLTSLLFARLIQLHISHTDFLQAQGNARTLRIIDIPSYRGLIMDRRQTPLAISTPVHAVWIDPRHFSATKEEVNKLAKILGLSIDELSHKLEQSSHREFIYLKRNVTPDVSEKVKSLKLTGVNLKREFRRYYPAGRQTAQLIGFTDIDDHGQAGIELMFQDLMKPVFGKKKVLEDRTGQWVKDIDHLQTAHSGQDITLSIDLRIQSFAYRELEQAIREYNAKSATLVMLDVQTGEVLAMISAPSFNPNNRQECHGSATRNRALTDLVEPGSTVKAFSVASALSKRTLGPETLIDTSPGYYHVANHMIKDLRNYGVLSLRDVLSKSSNVGISKITLALPPENLINTFRALGLGDSINTNFPGERNGTLPAPPKNPFVHATLAFGYGLSVTPLQLAHAYATLATKGVKRPISLTKIEDPSDLLTQQVLPADVAENTLLMLTDVLEHGTGTRANIPGYKTAGKTGTTRIVGPQGYDPNRHMALFAGITPVNHPRLATVVIIEEPNEKFYSGGLVAAPIYKNVVSKALYILNIPPDDI